MSPVHNWIRRSIVHASFLLAAGSTSVTAQVVTDGEWKVSAQEESGWTAPDFDDSKWAKIEGTHPNAWSGGDPLAWLPDQGAMAVWSGVEQPQAFLRRTFEVPEDRPQPVVAFIQADDDYELYLNGDLVAENKDRMLTVPGEAYDVTSQIRPGKNVVAIRGVDWGFGEHVLFALHFGQAAPPQPGAAAEPQLPAPQPARPSRFFDIAVAVVGGLTLVLAAGLLIRRILSRPRGGTAQGPRSLARRTWDGLRWFIDGL